MTTAREVGEKVAAQRRMKVTLRGVSLVLVLIGLIISGYLSYVKLANTVVTCVGGEAFNCEFVQNSAYSKLAGIPIAYPGFLTYLALGAILLLQNRVALLQEYGVILVFGITLFAFLFSVWLVYAQAFLLQAFCVWCLSHEVTMTLLFIVSALRLRQTLSAPATN
jgi:uncharacterized membrane protein